MDVTIPSLGESVTEATIGRWLKEDGEAVAADEAILELESDKANMDLAAEQAGVLRILKPAGETVKAGDVVARIEPGAGAPPKPSASLPPAGAQAGAPATTGGPAGAGDGKAQPSSASTSPRDLPASVGAADEVLPGKGDRVPGEAGASVERPITPSVRRIAEEARIDPATIEGTGPRGRITKGDALAAAARSTATPGAAPAAAIAGIEAPPSSATAATKPASGTAPATPVAKGPGTAPREGERRVKMSRIRQVIARRLVDAQHTAAILTTFNEVDMSAVIELRTRYKDAFQKRHGTPLGFMSFFVKACCEAATVVPELNAEIQGDEIVYRDAVHMGVAVGTDQGLVVPIVRDADRLSFAEIEKEIARLAGLARQGKLSITDLSGGTFTISNGGIYGSLLSTPILTPPQSGILGMHKIEKRPVVIDDEIRVRPMMYLALSYDHRIVDGKGAVTFLVRVKEALEDPARLLLGV